MGGDTEAEEETQAAATGIDKPPPMPLAKNELVFLQSQPQTMQPEVSPAAPTQFFLLLQRQCLLLHQDPNVCCKPNKN